MMLEIRELLPQIAKRIAEQQTDEFRVRALAFDVDGYVKFSRHSESDKSERWMDSYGDWMGYENGFWPVSLVVTREAQMQPYQELGRKDDSSINEKDDEALFDELNLMIEMAKL